MIEYDLHDIVMMKKPHACGANEWEIKRMGMEIRLECQGCGHQVTMLRNDFNKRLKKVLRKADQEN
ncbi:DUF951 domain-containing protein [Weissella muntiaci]|jgi:hypothetical protein|uniref:DUF951 domain-containing protein n=1 Tax=Weissella muntiaci TaxID=2508881 RepID=A0A6C2C4W8_9LACO|nr:DUF951 domain-containing protein [Weissella muntiaci]TYC48998.1 DUF951 domain-containing protein [Weissella muntiaci]